MTLITSPTIAFDVEPTIKSKTYLTHVFDETVWSSASIRWPSADQKVHVYFDQNSEHFVCPRLKVIAKKFYSNKDKYGNLDYGQNCKKLIVLFNEPELNNLENFQPFLAAHESFHIAAQVYGGYIVLDNIYLDEDNYDFLSDFVALLHQSLIKTNKNSVCYSITNFMDNLTENQRVILLHKAMVEWPAEYYSKQTIFGNDDKNYSKFRLNTAEILSSSVDKAWVEFYMAGHGVIKHIEKTLKTSQWQAKVTRDETLLDIYLKQQGCKTYSESWVKNRVFSKRLGTESLLIALLTDKQEAAALLDK